MKKTEINEIKKQFNQDNCTATRICGCYVDADKNIKTSFSETFLTLAEEEIFKYFEIFKKTLSGTVGKNLLDLHFPSLGHAQDDKSNFLISLKDSELRDEDMLRSLYKSIIDSYVYEGNYLILLVYMAYDVPSIGSDMMELDDASEDVYKHLLCSICPVELSKPGLSYKPDENRIKKRDQDWVVGMPLHGFLFPAFTDRCSDLSSVLYYSKKPTTLQDGLIESLVGCSAPLSSSAQKETFGNMVEEVLGDKCDYETVKNIHENLSTMLAESKEDLRPSILDKSEFKSVLVESGVSEDTIEDIEEKLSNRSELDGELHLSNLVNTRSFEVKTPDISIKVSPDSAHLVETRVVDGIKSIVIPVTDEVEVNGVPVKIGPNSN